MRIISDFRDFYDIGMTYGQDKDLIWVRKPEEVKVSVETFGLKNHWFTITSKNSRNFLCRISTSFLVFCGKKLIVYEAKTYPGWHYKPESLMDTFYTTDLERTHANFTKVTGEEFKTPFKEDSWKSLHERKAWLDSPGHDLHNQFDCPIIHIASKGIVVKCPNLKDLGLHRVMDPYTTYQEIAMYISGVMGLSQCPTVEISDKSKVLKHGFDPRYGFRTRPKESS